MPSAGLPFEGLPPEFLTVPEEEQKRQAVDALRGYVYRVFQTVLAWFDLGADDVLLLEVAEDFALVAKDALRAVQVNDDAQSGSLTLRSPGVTAAIRALWNFQTANPEKDVRLTYLTTQRIHRPSKAKQNGRARS